MSTTAISPNMNLVVPVVGVEPGPQWATDIYNALYTTVDQHNHAPGSGVQINPSGILINAALPFNGNAITSLISATYNVSGSALTTPATTYVVGRDLYYTDTVGNQIQLTANGGPSAGTGNIGGLPSTPAGAGITWINSASTFRFLGASAAAGANIDVGTVVIRYPGSYPSPSGNYISLQAPSSLATGFAFTLPAALPASNNSLITTSTAGTQAYVVPDQSTITTSSGVLAVPTAGITTTQLANDSVTTVKILNANVTGSKIATGTITLPNLLTRAPGVSQSSGPYANAGVGLGWVDVVNGGGVPVAAQVTGTGKPIYIGCLPDGDTTINGYFTATYNSAPVRSGFRIDRTIRMGDVVTGTVLARKTIVSTEVNLNNLSNSSSTVPCGSLWGVDTTYSNGQVYFYTLVTNNYQGAGATTTVSNTRVLAYEWA